MSKGGLLQVGPGKVPEPDEDGSRTISLTITEQGSITFSIAHRGAGISAAHLMQIGKVLTMIGERELQTAWSRSAMETQAAMRTMGDLPIRG